MGITKGVDAALIANLEAGGFFPVVFVDVDWPTGIVRVNSSSKTITALGQSWTPVDTFGSISVPGEDISIGSPTASITLSGYLDDLIGELDRDPRNSTVNIYFGVLTSQDSATTDGAPERIFSGYVDGVDFEFNRDGDIASSSITLVLASGPSPRAYVSLTHSNETQLKAYPTDTAGEKVVHANKRTLNPDAWPQTD
tara:strand:- start:436 stop:1026 length:591 start_codon:yes stop_codon:yes gene_type:complete